LHFSSLSSGSHSNCCHGEAGSWSPRASPFYAPAGLLDSVLAVIVILANYMLQFSVRHRRRWLYFALVLNLGCLAYFKYRVFLATAAGLNLFTGDIVIPLGISFYVFQLSAFLIDINRGRAEPFTSLARFAFFKLFFAQLVAGPIMRWRKFFTADSL
jgi:alginate O-acetyltransferase complex protein AlgI